MIKSYKAGEKTFRGQGWRQRVVLFVLSQTNKTVSTVSVCVYQPQALPCDRKNKHDCFAKLARTQRMTNESDILINRIGTHLPQKPNKLEEITP